MCNCWEAKKCGREPGGKRTGRLGICPVALSKKLDGMNRGKNGGRVCWAVAGSLCGGKVQGTYAKKIKDCLECDFYKSVKKEEGLDYKDTGEILKCIKMKRP